MDCVLRGGLRRALAAATLVAAAASSQEAPARRAPSLRPVGGAGWEITPEVEAAVRSGLAWLAANQSSNGAWRGDVGYKVNASYRVTDSDASHVGITALALIAYLAAGEVPGRGTYGTNIDAAIDFLVGSTQENGYIQSNGTRMYSHAFATLALAEVYGMTTNRGVRDALQRSINLIADSQNKEGGWRYKPFAPESDMSITVCQVMALRAARNSGIYVSRTVIDDAVKYVKESARAPNEQAYWGGYRNRHFGLYNNGVFKYQNKPEARASFALTAAGVTTLYGAGIYEDPVIERGLDFMIDHFEDYNRNFATHYFFYYGNYYAVQAFYTAGGERWARYYRVMSDFLLRGQRQDGSWECDVGPGNAFATAVATLILAIPYQYLPIFQR